MLQCENPFVRYPTAKIGQYFAKGGKEALTPFGCGQCLFCRMIKAREWTNRLLLEAHGYDSSLFITLTYSDEFLPCGQLFKEELQQFIKKLRKMLPQKIRYYGVGEYGDETHRPHFHIIVFNMRPEQYPKAFKAWSMEGVQKGSVHIGEVNTWSCRYITGYISKKLDKENDWYKDGYLKEKHPWFIGKRPEFALQSKRKGGIGFTGLQHIIETLKQKDRKQWVHELRIQGKKYPLGRYLHEQLYYHLDLSTEEKEAMFDDYQDKVIFENLRGDNIYFESIIDQSKPKRDSRRKRHNIFKQSRSL